MKKTLCIGEALIDVIKDGETILESNVGGAPLNVACSISHLHGDAAFFGSIGNDLNGTKILELLTKHKVDHKFVQVLPNNKTSVAFVTIWGEGERNFVFELDADQKVSFDHIKNDLDQFDIFHFGSATSLLKAEPSQNYMQLLDYAVTHKKFISFDPNWRNLLWEEDKKTFNQKVIPFLQKANLVKMNEEELQITASEADVQTGLKKMIATYPQATFLITLGSEGSLIGNKDFIKHYKVVKSTNPVDSTGAGDAFIGYMLYKIAKLKDVSDWEQHVDKIMAGANEHAKKSIEYKGALTFLEV